MKKNITDFNYFKLALLSFLTLGLEGILASIEANIYNKPTSEIPTTVSHYILTCIIWSVAIFFILKYAVEKYDFKIKDDSPKVKVWQWVLVVLIVLFSIIIKYKSWGGFKVLEEFNTLGLLNFSIQYLYYFIESILFTIIVVFGQKAFEKWFKNGKIPYGGILCALTWGIAHIFTKGSLAVGLAGVIFGLFFGSTYLLLNRDFIKTFFVLFLMFVL